jgi:hypothetical protein
MTWKEADMAGIDFRRYLCNGRKEVKTAMTIPRAAELCSPVSNPDLQSGEQERQLFGGDSHCRRYAGGRTAGNTCKGSELSSAHKVQVCCNAPSIFIS